MDIAVEISEVLSKSFAEARKLKPVQLSEPDFTGNEAAYVQECIKTGWVSSVGSFVDRFERDLASFVGSGYAVAIVNGTAALHLCLVAADVRADDEVLVPALTFVATANAVMYQQAIPHFVEVSDKTLGICPYKLDEYLGKIADIKDGICVNRHTGRQIKAVVPMHTFGHMVDMDALLDVARKYHLLVIEDAAESLGSSYKGRPSGTMGYMAAVSFNGNKIVTTGGGGAVLTQDPALAGKLKHLSTTARVADGYSFRHDMVGFNYRMPNINAALGCAQLERLPRNLAAKRALAHHYQKCFDVITGVRFMTEPAETVSNYWLNAIRVSDRATRDAVLELTNRAGYMTRPVWDLMPALPMYKDMPCMDIPVAKDMADTIVNLPSSAFLADYLGTGG